MPVMQRLSVRDLLHDDQLTSEDVQLVFQTTSRIKSSPMQFSSALAGNQLAMVFEKPSLRTRTAFEVGMTSMGGHAVYLDYQASRLGKREPIKDVARCLQKWTDGIAVRAYHQETVEELATHASIPVINALTDLYHPCQALSDLYTLTETFGTVKGLKLAFIGDGNNVCRSLILTAHRCGAKVMVASPPGYEPQFHGLGFAFTVTHNPRLAVKDASAVYTDIWSSEPEPESDLFTRMKAFAPFQVNDKLMSMASPEAVFMHCLPARRGQEVADSVIESDRSVVFQQAENRLHVHKALLFLLLGV